MCCYVAHDFSKVSSNYFVLLPLRICPGNTTAVPPPREENTAKGRIPGKSGFRPGGKLKPLSKKPVLPSVDAFDSKLDKLLISRQERGRITEAHTSELDSTKTHQKGVPDDAIYVEGTNTVDIGEVLENCGDKQDGRKSSEAVQAVELSVPSSQISSSLQTTSVSQVSSTNAFQPTSGVQPVPVRSPTVNLQQQIPTMQQSGAQSMVHFQPMWPPPIQGGFGVPNTNLFQVRGQEGFVFTSAMCFFCRNSFFAAVGVLVVCPFCGQHVMVPAPPPAPQYPRPS